jgi:hypothetical protein
MGALSRDTTRAAEQAQLEVLRAMPAWRKLELVADGCETNRALVLAGLRSRHPSASEEELQRLLMGLVWGEPQATMIWGPPAPHRR